MGIEFDGNQELIAVNSNMIQSYSPAFSGSGQNCTERWCCNARELWVLQAYKGVSVMGKSLLTGDILFSNPENGRKLLSRAFRSKDLKK